MKSGQSSNIIPDYGVLVVNIRGEIAPFEDSLKQISSKRQVEIKVTDQGYRPPRDCLPKTWEYIELLGAPSEPSFGVSDSNYLEAVGLPTLDGLGPTGIQLHSQNEHLVISSLEKRLDQIKQLIEKL